MAREPQRREQPAPLGAAIVPVQRALIARAAFLSLRASQRNAIMQDDIIKNGPNIESALDVRIADELRALADELGHW
jgi:hypothetical protein